MFEGHIAKIEFVRYNEHLCPVYRFFMDKPTIFGQKLNTTFMAFWEGGVNAWGLDYKSIAVNWIPWKHLGKDEQTIIFTISLNLLHNDADILTMESRFGVTTPRLKIWLDDVRTPPDGAWVWIKTPDKFFETVLGKTDWRLIETVSMDHDLGDTATGYDLLVALKKRAEQTEQTVPFKIRVHSMNPVGRDKMLNIIRDMAKQGLVQAPGA